MAGNAGREELQMQAVAKLGLSKKDAPCVNTRSVWTNQEGLRCGKTLVHFKNWQDNTKTSMLLISAVFFHIICVTMAPPSPKSHCAGLCRKTAAHSSRREREGGEGIWGSKEYKAELVGLRTIARTDLHLARATQLPAGNTHTRLRKGSGQQCS